MFLGGGNIPNTSLFEQDAGSSLESSRNQSMSSRQEHVYQTAKSTVKETQSDSGSDDESPKNKKKSKGKGKKVVHIVSLCLFEPCISRNQIVAYLYSRQHTLVIYLT
jgi:hypothetical protein